MRSRGCRSGSFLAASAVARLGVALVPTDLEGQPRTAAGRLHLVLAVLSFALLYTAIDNATPLMTARAGGVIAAALPLLRWTAAASLAALVLCLLAPPLRGLFGLAERAFLIATPLWMLLASLALALGW